jgi:MFS family permease
LFTRVRSFLLILWRNRTDRLTGYHNFSTFTASVYAASVYQVSREFHVSITTALLGLSMYVIGLGLGPMFSAPLSEVFGRKMVYFINLPIFLLFTLGTGLAQNIQTLIICRAFAGIFGGPALAVSAGSFVDIWDLKTSGSAVTVQAFATFMGPALGGFKVSNSILCLYSANPPF